MLYILGVRIEVIEIDNLLKTVQLINLYVFYLYPILTFMWNKPKVQLHLTILLVSFHVKEMMRSNTVISRWKRGYVKLFTSIDGLVAVFFSLLRFANQTHWRKLMMNFHFFVYNHNLCCLQHCSFRWAVVNGSWWDFVTGIVLMFFSLVLKSWVALRCTKILLCFVCKCKTNDPSPCHTKYDDKSLQESSSFSLCWPITNVVSVKCCDLVRSLGNRSDILFSESLLCLTVWTQQLHSSSSFFLFVQKY